MSMYSNLYEITREDDSVVTIEATDVLIPLEKQSHIVFRDKDAPGTVFSIRADLVLMVRRLKVDEAEPGDSAWAQWINFRKKQPEPDTEHECGIYCNDPACRVIE